MTSSSEVRSAQASRAYCSRTAPSSSWSAAHLFRLLVEDSPTSQRRPPPRTRGLLPASRSPWKYVLGQKGVDGPILALALRLRSDIHIPCRTGSFDRPRNCGTKDSMKRQAVKIRKKRGPLATGKGTQIQVRLQPDDLAAVDAWRDEQDDSPSRPEAIRMLLRQSLRGKRKD